MQLIKKTVLLAAIVLVTALGSTLKAQSACDRLWATENELLTEHAGNFTVNVTDTKGVLMRRWPPSADGIASTPRRGVNNPPSIVIVDNPGRRVQSLQLPADSPV